MLSNRPMRLWAPIALALIAGGEAAAKSFVSGTALYNERIALPPGAVFVATLEDVSRVGGKAEELGRITLEKPKQPPFTFRIAYDPARIDQRSRYAVRARITLDGRLLFTTDQMHPVLTGGAGSEVSIVMRRVAQEPSVPPGPAGPPYFGDWRVTGFSIPGISAMTTQEAGRVVGTRASYGDSAASFGTNRCARPSYETRTLSADDFMVEYRFPPKSLGLEGQPTITLVTVTCSPTWSNQGATLIVKSPTSLIATWDGAFFDLGRPSR